MAHLKLTLDTRKIKENNTYPIIFRITNKGKSRDISTGFYLHKNDWDEENGSFKKNALTNKHYSKRLKELEIKYLNMIIEFEKSHANYLIQKLKEFLTETPKPAITAYNFWLEEIALLHKSNRNGGAVVYQESLNALHKVRNLNISFENVDYIFLRELEAQLISNGLKLNSIGVYFRTLRAIYNKAIKSKIVSIEHYPFKLFIIKKSPTTPRPINLSELKRYFHLKLDASSFLYDSWLIGKLMFMLIGINFKDMIMLSEINLTTNRLIYSRAKTKKIYSIKLLDEALEIINYFRGRHKSTLLGKITETDLDKKSRFPLIVKQKNRNFNKHIEKIGKMIGCKVKLTGYVFRYTWANIAKQLGYSKDLIAEALGHEYGNKVTGIYLEAYDKSLIDEMNQKIYMIITKNKRLYYYKQKSRLHPLKFNVVVANLMKLKYHGRKITT